VTTQELSATRGLVLHGFCSSRANRGRVARGRATPICHRRANKASQSGLPSHRNSINALSNKVTGREITGGDDCSKRISQQFPRIRRIARTKLSLLRVCNTLRAGTLLENWELRQPPLTCTSRHRHSECRCNHAQENSRGSGLGVFVWRRSRRSQRRDAADARCRCHDR
jgi:hypothetical protein